MVFVFLRASKMIGNCYSFYVICYMTLKVFMLQEIRGFFFFSHSLKLAKCIHLCYMLMVFVTSFTLVIFHKDRNLLRGFFV